MPLLKNKIESKIMEYNNYFDSSLDEVIYFETLYDEFKKIGCELYVEKDIDTPFYRIRFLDIKTKRSIHLDKIYKSREDFINKFITDPDTWIKSQNMLGVDLQTEKEENDYNLNIKKEGIIRAEGIQEKQRKQNYKKKIREEKRKQRELEREKSREDFRNNLTYAKITFGIFLLSSILGLSCIELYKKAMDKGLEFHENGNDLNLDNYNTNLPQTLDQTQPQSDTQTESQEQSAFTNNSEPTTIEGKPFTGDISDFFNENTVIISHSRMNGIKHLLPKSIKEENYYAVDSATTANGIEWMKAATENTTITRVYISMGINDLVKSDMDQLIEEAHKKFPNAIIYVQEEYVANRFDKNRRNLLKEFNEHSKELCSGLDYAYYIEITNNKNNLAHENGNIIGEEDEVYGIEDGGIHVVDPPQQEKVVENMNEGLHDGELDIYSKTHKNTSQNSTADQSAENTREDTQNNNVENNTNNNGNIYYVSKEDNTDERTSKTISEAIEKAQPGDTIIVKEGTYNEKVKVHNKKDITIKAEGEVIIDGKNLSGSLFSIKNSQKIYVDGFVFAHILADSSQGVKVYGNNTSDITIDNCTFEDIRCVHEKAPDKGSNAIYVVGSSTTPINNIVIKNCKCTDVAAGFSEVISFEGNITNFLIENVMITSNTVKSNIGICICGNQGTCKDKKLDRPRNGTIKDSNVSNCLCPYEKDNSSTYGIYIDGGKDIIVENNTVSLCEGGIEVGAEIASNAYSRTKNGETENITVRNNYILNCGHGAQIGGFESQRGTVYKVVFEGNVIQNCGDKDKEMLVLTKCNNVTIRNNKFESDADEKIIIIMIQMYEKMCYDLDFEKNDFKVKYIKENPNAKCFEYKGRQYNYNNWLNAIKRIMSQER